MPHSLIQQHSRQPALGPVPPYPNLPLERVDEARKQAMQEQVQQLQEWLQERGRTLLTSEQVQHLLEPASWHLVQNMAAQTRWCDYLAAKQRLEVVQVSMPAGSAEVEQLQLQYAEAEADLREEREDQQVYVAALTNYLKAREGEERHLRWFRTVFNNQPDHNSSSSNTGFKTP